MGQSGQRKWKWVAKMFASVPDFQSVGNSANLHSSLLYVCLSPHNHIFLQHMEIENTKGIFSLKTHTVLQNSAKKWRGPKVIVLRSHSSFASYL